MKRDEFLKKAKQQSQSRTYEEELAPLMETISEYYELIAKELNDGNIDKPFSGSGDSFEYTAKLSSKILKYVRVEDAIEVHHIDINKNSDEIIDRITVSSGRAPYSEKKNEIFNFLTMDAHVPYLLEDD